MGLPDVGAVSSYLLASMRMHECESCDHDRQISNSTETPKQQSDSVSLFALVPKPVCRLQLALEAPASQNFEKFST
jgi:hypothetical protein